MASLPLPHDVPDLLLAPVVLALDARLEELGRLGGEALRNRIASDSGIGDTTPQLREAAVVATVCYLEDV